MTSLRRTFKHSIRERDVRRNRPGVRDSARGDGAFMEPRGCNRLATGRKSNGLKNRRNTRKPLPCVATSCHLERMVRRGSTVRVRQRALQNPRTTGASCFGSICRSSNVGQVWSPLWSLQVENAVPGEPLRATARRQQRFGSPQHPRSGCSASRARSASLTTQRRRAVARRPSMCGRPSHAAELRPASPARQGRFVRTYPKLARAKATAGCSTSRHRDVLNIPSLGSITTLTIALTGLSPASSSSWLLDDF